MELHYQLLESLKEAFSTYEKKLDKIKHEIYKKVITWKWATTSQAHLELFSLEKSRRPKGKWLKGEPHNFAEYVKVGFDSENRIIVEEEFQSHSDWGHDRIYLHELDSILSLEYDKQRRLQRLEKAVYMEGKQEWYASFSAKNRANSVDRYYYEQAKVTRIESLWLYDEYIQTPIYYITYNTIGKVEFVRRVDSISKQFPKGQDVFVYKKKAISNKELMEGLIKETVKQINLIIQQLHEQEPCYCLMLVLVDAFGRDDWFPPTLALGLESERKNWGKDADQVWSPYFFKHTNIELKGKELEEHAQLFMQECELKSKYGLPGSVLKKMAKVLRDQKLERILNVTDDFVIVPYDYDTPSIIDNLKGVYSNREIKKLITKGVVLD